MATPSSGSGKVVTASKAAEAEGVNRSTISRRMKKLGMSEKTRAGKRAQALTPADRARVKSAGAAAKGKDKPGPSKGKGKG